ncbi:MAG: hypothetical protein JSS09_00510 [Verrucomicrobia bacterium]|nr:hypothetical protein [Verrucomicrobiota bacterium]
MDNKHTPSLSPKKPLLSNPLNSKKDRACPIAISSTEVDGKNKVQITDENNTPVSDLTEDFFKLTGTQNNDLAREVIGHGALAVHAFDATPEAKFNLSMQALAEAQPRDVIEARLVTQANALYTQGMNYLGGIAQAKDLETAQFFLNGATKLLRLHNETIECYGKYLRKGESKVVVQHVTINDNGKAIVAGMVEGQGHDQKNGEVTP